MLKAGLKVAGAIALGVAVAMSVQAADKITDKMKAPDLPSSVSESAPDKAGKADKGKAGVPTIPSTSKSPASVSESAPQKTGKEPVAPMSKKGDSKAMANPKSPSSVDESAPQKTGDADKKAKGSKKEQEKAMAK